MMTTISVCMIIKDEARHLERVISECRAFADEIVIVDTGSTDGSLEIAQRLADRFSIYPWNDDFSAARNRSLDLATKDYILIVDGDDRIEPNQADKINQLKAQMEGEQAQVYRFRIVNDGFEEWNDITQIRLFPNRTDLRYAGRAHNELESAVAALGIPTNEVNIAIHHAGYVDPEIHAAKRKRTLYILEKEYAEHPNSDRINSYLGSLLFVHGQWERSRFHLEKAITVMDDHSNPEAVWGRYLSYPPLVQVLHHLGEREKAANVLRRFIDTVRGTKHEAEATDLIEGLGLWEMLVA